MKQILFALLLFPLILSGQLNYTWDIVSEGVEGNKKELFESAEIWVARTFIDSKEVIQLKSNEDRIIAKGIIKTETPYYMARVEIYFQFSLTLSFKDGKFRTEVDQVNCYEAIGYGSNGAGSWPCLSPSMNVPEKRKDRNDLTKNQYLNIMTSLKNQIQTVINDYNTHMRTNQLYKDDDW